jgi:hypothetical protein
MTVPGVNVQTAAAFMASIGDISRFSSPRKLVSYLGLDPRVRQSGNTPARHGRISKAGAAEARHMLGEASWRVILCASVDLQPPPSVLNWFQRPCGRRLAPWQGRRRRHAAGADRPGDALHGPELPGSAKSGVLSESGASREGAAIGTGAPSRTS